MVRWLVVLSSFLILGACRPSTAPELVPSGELSALLSGAIQDTYLAVGAEPTDRRQQVTFASARPGQLSGMYGIMGMRARSDTQDAFLLELEGVTETGVFPAQGSFQFGDPDVSLGSGRIFDFATGQVEVTSLTSERIRGTFEGIAVEVMVLFPPQSPPDTLWVSEGRFDVPVVPFSR